MNQKPHYYLMKNKKILRLESGVSFDSLSLDIKERLFNPDEIIVLNQEEANWRVAIFRDEIMDLEEFTSWLTTPEALLEEECELDLVAN